MRDPIDTGAQRFSVQLDAGVLVEALILARLASLPKRRHGEWLRGLLAQGYVVESRLLRELRAEPAAGASGAAPVGGRPPRREYARPPRGDTPSASDAPTPGREAAPRTLRPSQEGIAPGGAAPGDGDKPFRHLRTVIG